jgi:hypothetical protein
MNPKELLYAKSHEWVKIEGDEAVVGISHFAQQQLGDLTFVELPQRPATRPWRARKSAPSNRSRLPAKSTLRSAEK